MKKDQEEEFTTYTVLGKNTKLFFEFKFDLDGDFKQFKILDGKLSEQQIDFLFHPARFPYKEIVMESWKKAIKNLEITVQLPDLTFENFYNLYGYKVDPKGAQKAWERTTKTDRILALKSIRPYKSYLQRKGVAQAYPATYLNKQLYLSQYNAY